MPLERYATRIGTTDSGGTVTLTTGVGRYAGIHFTDDAPHAYTVYDAGEEIASGSATFDRLLWNQEVLISGDVQIVTDADTAVAAFFRF